jgi:hypothetical protein
MQTNPQTHKQTNKQTSKQASKQTNKETTNNYMLRTAAKLAEGAMRKAALSEPINFKLN